MNYLDFKSATTALQGNDISIAFNKVIDESVYGGYAQKYKYSCQYTPIYCNPDSKSQYAYYDNAAWETAFEKEIEFNTIGKYAEFEMSVPQFNYDVVLRVQMQVGEDSSNNYYTATAGSLTQTFVAFYNQNPIYNLKSIERDPDDNITIHGELVESGLFSPINRGSQLYNKDGWISYCDAIVACFNPYPEPKLTWQISDAPAFNALIYSKDCTPATIADWHPQELQFFLEAGPVSVETNTYHRLILNYNKSAELNDDTYKFAADWTDENGFITNTILLTANMPSFQIKRRAVKSQMLKNDKILGYRTTGAGMFNHSDLVGFNDIGHSIALYDTHVEEGASSPTNEPSIGFMSNNHDELASLTFKDGRLESSVPITYKGYTPGGGGSEFPMNSITLITTNGNIEIVGNFDS